MYGLALSKYWYKAVLVVTRYEVLLYNLTWPSSVGIGRRGEYCRCQFNHTCIIDEMKGVYGNTIRREPEQSRERLVVDTGKEEATNGHLGIATWFQGPRMLRVWLVCWAGRESPLS